MFLLPCIGIFHLFCNYHFDGSIALLGVSAESWSANLLPSFIRETVFPFRQKKKEEEEEK